jgi:WD40 repeat protein
MSGDERFNPFPGPQPYRASDSDRFFGREQFTRRLVNRILARPYVTLFGPSGAGKSSLMQAAVIPLLRKKHHFRTVCVDTWLAHETPLERLVKAIFVDLELDGRPEELGSQEALAEAIRLAEEKSDRPLLIYLDQFEKLLRASRPPEKTDELLESLGRLTRMPLRGIQLVVSLREDYLGRFRDRVRGQQSLQDPGFRLGPLTVKEMARVACLLAGVGEPAQQWSEEKLRELMRQVRMPGQADTELAEVQTAFAQIVCRALWEERGRAGETWEVSSPEPILHRYLEATLEGLGPLRADALKLLEEHLIAKDGSRTLLTEQQARTLVFGQGAAEQVLGSLERAAVLRAEEHQGSRYFELGHDWLANKVLELKRERELQEKAAQARQEEELRRQRERSTRRRLIFIASVAVGVALAMALLLFMVERAQKRAFDQSMMAGAREQMALGQPAVAIQLLLKAEDPAALKGWIVLAQEALESNFLELTLRGSELSLNTASYRRDGQRIVTAGDDGVLLWRANGKGKPLRLGTPGEPVLSAVFSPEGQRVLTASRDGAVRVWRVDGRRDPSVQVELHADQVRSAAFSPDGKHIVIASADGTARVRRADGSGVTVVLAGHERGLTSAVFSPDGRSIVTSSWDGTARVWRADGEGKPLLLEGHQGPVRSAAFSHDGQLIVTASDDGTARVWRVNDPEPLRVFEGHDGPVRSAAFSQEDPLGLAPQRIVTASDDATVRVWRVDGVGAPIVFTGHEGPVRSAEFRQDNWRIVTASWDRTVRVWRVGEVEAGSGLRMLTEHEAPVTAAAFSPDGRYLATGSRDKLVRLWTSDGSMLLHTFKGHTDAIMSVTFGPDSQRIITTSRDKTARVWWANDWGRHLVLEGHADDVSSAAFTPVQQDVQHIVTASWDKTAWVWGADGSGPLFKLEGHTGRVTSVAFSTDGQHILTADSTGVVRKWRADGPGEPEVLAKHTSGITSITYNWNGTLLLMASTDGTARWWRADGTGEPVVFKGHNGPVYSAAFSPYDDFIVTASSDNTARVWRIDDPRQFSVLEGHEGPVQFATFNPRGEYIATASWDRTAWLWPLSRYTPPSIEDLKKKLEADTEDCLGANLRQTYFNEKEDEAWERYEACERSHERSPPQRVEPSARSTRPVGVPGLGAGAGTVRLP